MFKINFVAANINVSENTQIYGFKYNFDKGLNIITGQNSSGKSSVLSCIYYNLGMEQLLGLSTSKSSLLDKCLTSQFRDEGHTYNITQSMITLEIENESGEKALLERYARTYDNNDKNTIKVTLGNKKCKYYLHSIEDHTNKNGYYKWLQDFIGIELPIDSETNKKTLYLQNIFSCCFIEQTKGWSDFMAQMPSFNIKDAKRKVVEYLLSLKCLDNDIEKDKLASEKNNLVDSWNRALEKFYYFDYSLSYKVDGLSNKYEKSKIDSLNKLQLKVNVDSEWLDIKTVKRNAENKVNKLKKFNRENEKKKSSNAFNSKRKELKSFLLKINRIKNTLDRSYSTEKFKIDDYKNNLERLKEERSNIVGARKVDDVFSALLTSENCPLCESEVTIDNFDKNITNEDYDSSIKFIDSKISMITGYLDKFSDYHSDYLRESNYYENLVYETKTELENIDRDSNENVDKELLRSNIYEEMLTSGYLNKINALNDKFFIFKNEINSLNTEISNLDVKINNLKGFFDEDEEKISRLQSLFRYYLTNFLYTSNETYRVKINSKNPYKAFPSVFNASVGSAQPIRLASSASDFIRAEWSYYLALLIYSNIHPGVLIFDEPGQHAMNIDSMKRLLEESEKIQGKQLIFAISKYSRTVDLDKRDDEVSIRDLTKGLKQFKEIEIDFNKEKLVSKL